MVSVSNSSNVFHQGKDRLKHIITIDKVARRKLINSFYCRLRRKLISAASYFVNNTVMLVQEGKKSQELILFKQCSCTIST